MREIRTQDREIKLRVALADEETDSLADLVRTPISVRGTNINIPLSKVATFEQRKGAGDVMTFDVRIE